MKIETTLPYSWLRTLSPSIQSLDEIPLWGNPPPFPWKQLGDQLGKALQIEGLVITPKDVSWKTPEELISGLGKDPKQLSFQVSPLTGFADLFLPKEDLKALLKTIIGKEEKIPHADEAVFEDEFTHFLAIEAALAFQKISFDQALSPQLITEGKFPEEPCLCIDVELTMPHKKITARLALSPQMRASIAERYAEKSMQYPPGLSEAILVEGHLVAGHVTLSKNEWKAAEPGDFVVLDSCTYIPGDEKGRLVLTVNESPLFRVKLKDGNIKLLEYPVLQEVQTSMAKPTDEDFEDEEFQTEESSVTGDETFEGETEGETEDFTEEEELTEEDEITEGETLQKPATKSARPQPISKGSAAKPTQQAAAPMTKPDEIPLTIAVEVGRLQMTLQKLTELQPGNVLELNVIPENGVDLVISGRVVGKGELLKLGDALGVRILEKA